MFILCIFYHMFLHYLIQKLNNSDVYMKILPEYLYKNQLYYVDEYYFKYLNIFTSFKILHLER